MMKPRHATTKLEALDLMLEAAIVDHKSHESRNRQLSVIRGILDQWIPEFNSYTSQEDEERKTRPTLEAIYQLCIWQLDHETHTCVKDRLCLAKNLIAIYFRRVEELRQKKYGIPRRWQEQPDPTEPEEIPSEALILDAQDVPF